eukprot:COSAG04_NODE_5832_length_1480_cov_8.383056_2_plen_67_part_00
MNFRALQDGSGSEDGSLAGPAPLGPDAGDAVDAAMALADELAWFCMGQGALVTYFQVRFSLSRSGR